MLKRDVAYGVPAARLGLGDPGQGLRQARWAGRVALWVLLAALTLGAFVWAQASLARLDWGLGLDYGEGVVWQQALTLADGSAYGAITHMPATVFNYPPLFHLLLLGLAEMGLDMLVAGRALSALSCLGAAVAAGMLAWQALRGAGDAYGARIAAIVAGLLVLGEPPLLLWSSIVRVDMLAVALAMAGLAVGTRARTSPAAALGAMTLFALAVYTKQTMVTVPVGFLLALVAVDRRAALRVAIFGIVLAGVPLLGLIWATGGAFVDHILLYNAFNRYDIAQISTILVTMRYLAITLALGLCGAGFCVASLEWGPLPPEPARFSRLLLAVNAVLLVPHVLALAKSGAASNYLVLPLCVLAPLVGIAFGVAATVGRNARSWMQAMLLPVLVAALLVQVWRGHRPAQLELEQLAAGRQVIAAIRAAPGPVLTEDPTLTLLAGRRYLVEPAMMAELTSTGLWDETPLLAMLESRRFSLVVLEGREDASLFDERFSERVRAAFRRYYLEQSVIGGHVLLRPAS